MIHRPTIFGDAFVYSRVLFGVGPAVDAVVENDAKPIHYFPSFQSGGSLNIAGRHGRHIHPMVASMVISDRNHAKLCSRAVVKGYVNWVVD